MTTFGVPDHANVPPHGWEASSGILQPSGQVKGYAHRKQTVRGLCQITGCNRRVHLDPIVLCKEGLAALPMRSVMQLWRCNRLSGCGLEFHNEKMEVPLILHQFVGKPNVRVRLKCRSDRCKFLRIWRVEEIVAGLDKRGRDGDRTDVAELGGLMTTACPICKKTSWLAEILWINVETAEWRAQGERAFDRRAQAPGES